MLKNKLTKELNFNESENENIKILKELEFKNI